MALVKKKEAASKARIGARDQTRVLPSLNIVQVYYAVCARA